MTKGYVMVECKAGKEESVFSELGKFSWVKEVHPLFGEYDFILHVESKTAQDLADNIIGQLRNLDGIHSTKTFLEASFSGQPVK